MRLLLDTHIVLWWFENNPLLSTPARDAIREGRNEVFVSAATTWEMTIKKALKKLSFPDDIEERMQTHRFIPLPITQAHTFAVGELPRHHKDPFDRLLVDAPCSIATIEPETVEFLRAVADADAKFESSIGENIYGGTVFSHADRIVQWEQEHGGADADGFSAHGDCSGER